jgi:hypothetical protein
MKHALASFLVLSLVTACDDNDSDSKPNKPTDPVVRVAVDYELSESQIVEDKGSFPVVINFSAAAEADGVIEVTLSGDAMYDTHFATTPAAVGNKVTLAVEKGDTEVELNVTVVNNSKLNGHKAAVFSIVNATGSVVKGESLEFTLTVKDDELLQKLKGMVKVGSVASQVKNTYEYNEDGQITKIHWESKGVFGTTTGTEGYFYDENGKILRMAREGTTLETLYSWENGLLTRQERVQNGAVANYHLYEYDANSRVKKTSTFIANGLGDFTQDSYSEYVYHDDGNIHRVTFYSYDPIGEEFVVSMVTTYNNYIEGKNPSPIELFPGHSIQQKLPTYYSRSSASGTQEYQVAYEFLENGNLIKKTVTGAVADSGVTTYTYFD